MQKAEMIYTEVSELWNDILEGIIADICREPSPAPPTTAVDQLTTLIPHTYFPSYKIHHARVYQQWTDNLCGYHATFNTLCFLSLLHGTPNSYDILSGASFWSFKRSLEKFLLTVKDLYCMPEEEPWREQDILFGDFERTYNSICLEQSPDFAIIREQEHFQFLSFTWEFQYQNLLLSEDKIYELEFVINQFKAYRGEKPLVVGFMLAITNHWMLLIAVKFKEVAQYWFFDSNNLDFLLLNHAQIDELVEKLDKEEKELGRKGFTEFHKKNIGMCMRDTQISLQLIVDCLEGKTTIEEYAYNQQFRVFAMKLEKHWDHDLEATERVIKDYWYNIAAFFTEPLQQHLLTPQNQERLARLTQVSHELRDRSEQASSLFALIKQYSAQTGWENLEEEECDLKFKL